MPVTDADRLRRALGERIPTGGSASDTMFSSDEIDDILLQGGSDDNLSAYYGWVAKTAELANLVDTAEGSSKREMGQLHTHALAQVKYYEGLTGITVDHSRHARVGNITRPFD